MGNTIEKLLFEPIQEFFKKLVDFLPNLLSSLIIIVSGLVIAYLLKYLFVRFLKILHFDKFCERFGINMILLKGGIRDLPSNITGRLLYWAIAALFVVVALNSLRVPSVEHLMTKLLLYLPNVLIAVIIVVFGYIVGHFLSRAALITLVNAGVALAGPLSHVIKLGVFLMAVTMALEQLGIGSATIIIAFGIIFGGVVLALAIAFGLGGKDIAKDYLEKRMVQKKEEPDDIQHL